MGAGSCCEGEWPNKSQISDFNLKVRNSINHLKVGLLLAQPREHTQSFVKIGHTIPEGKICYGQAVLDGPSFEYSRISPGWQSSTSQMASKVLNLIAFAFPVFSMERLDKVRPTLSESSLSDILRFAITTSKLTTIAMNQTVKSFSCCRSVPFLKTNASK